MDVFAEAQNSLGEYDADGDFSTGGTVGANAAVTWANGNGTASAPAPPAPPDLNVTASGASDVDIPGQTVAQASSLGRGALYNTFTITGGIGTVDVDFSVDIAGDLYVFTDKCGVFAETEVIFGLELDGAPILFHDDLLSIGSNSSATLSVSESLFDTRTLEYDVPYFLWLECDSESAAANVPEPSTIALMFIGLGGLAGFAWRRRLRKIKKKMSKKTGLLPVIFLLLTFSLLLSQSSVDAKYIGGGSP